MKLVKFNVRTSFHNIPDAKYKVECEKAEKLEDEDLEAFAKKIIGRSKYAYINVNINEEVEVPNWYFEAHKNDMCEVPVHIAQYNKEGLPLPFRADDALRHGYIKTIDESIRKVSRFTLIADLDIKKPA